MQTSVRAVATATLLLSLSLAPCSPALAQGPSPASDSAYQETAVSTHATGTFEVKLTPRAPDDSTDTSALGRMTIDKQYHGDLEGTGQGQMFAAMSSNKTSGGYVALERVTGTLHGRRGSFVLQHSGTMTRSVPHLVITVVPDSGTDELIGISGTMAIIIEGGKHSYDFEYTLDAP
jgi:hypothetical protein